MTQAELKFYEMACNFFAKQNRSDKVKVKNIVVDGKGKSIEEIDEELNKAMENKRIVDVKVTPTADNVVLYTFLYKET